MLWLAMTTGARRGELCAVRWSSPRNLKGYATRSLCAVRWSSINLEQGRETLWLRHAITRTEAGWTEGGLKTHQQRRIALDGETAASLGEHRDLWAERFAALGFPFNEDGYAFANVADAAIKATVRTKLFISISLRHWTSRVFATWLGTLYPTDSAIRAPSCTYRSVPASSARCCRHRFP